MKHLYTNAMVAGLAVITATACNGTSTSTSFLSTADIGIVQQNGQSMIQMSSVFNLGNVSLSEISVDVVDPKTQKPVGTVGFSQLPANQGKITLDVNTSLLSNGDADLGLSLPNGRPIPAVLGATRGSVLGVNLLQNSRVYLGGDLRTGVTAGVAFVIPALDSVMDRLSTAANIFFMGNYGTVTGVGGIFGSSTADESGIAVFAKYTPSPVSLVQQQQVHEEKDFEIEKLDKRTQRRLNRFFFGKHRKVQAK